MDGIIADLIRRRSACEQGITDQNQKIRRYEKAYESLKPEAHAPYFVKNV